MNHTVDEEEVRKFNQMASMMWKEDGEFKALHAMNELRVPLIRDALALPGTWRQTPRPLEGKLILDAGCGGGILSEPLARLGAFVVAIDASENNIQIAQSHMMQDPLLREQIKYIHCDIEDLIGTEEGKFDGVVSSEVLEHVSNVDSFVESCCRLVKPGGSLFFTTVNKTQLSYYLGVIAAEYIFKIVPPGTHDWEKFVPPEELRFMLSKNEFSTKLIHGMFYNLLTGRWMWIKDSSLSYAIHAVKGDHCDYSSSSESSLNGSDS